jgi:hypothetical protein
MRGRRLAIGALALSLGWASSPAWAGPPAAPAVPRAPVKPLPTTTTVPSPAAMPSAAPAATPSGAPAATPSAAPASAPAESIGGCVETIPQGARKPVLIDHFPVRGYSGYAQTLSVTVEHGRGETVLARGIELQSESDAAKALKQAGFVIPDQSGVDAARLKTAPPDPKHPDHVTTTLELPLVALPPDPGRHTLTLPPLPVAVSRANGDIATACTSAHTIIIEDPTSSTPEPSPKANPDPRPQREEWTSLRKALTYGAIGLVAGALLAYLIRKWMLRPKAVPPPPPPRPPWEVALERLDEVRHAGLLEVGRFQEYFDRVNDAVRDYLGGRYGFDGLESTTDEILQALKRATLDDVAMPAIMGFLDECDLVKFAKFTPTTDECTRALDSAERIVRVTMPRMAGGASMLPATAPAVSPLGRPPEPKDGPPGPEAAP